MLYWQKTSLFQIGGLFTERQCCLAPERQNPMFADAVQMFLHKGICSTLIIIKLKCCRDQIYVFWKSLSFLKLPGSDQKGDAFGLLTKPQL